jgi:hypothetical protein
VPGEVDEQVEVVGRDQRATRALSSPASTRPRRAPRRGILAGPLRVVEVRVDLERVGIVRANTRRMNAGSAMCASGDR